jgi:hypothetical protein
LLSSNNLSDLSNTSTARTNLGLAYATSAQTNAGFSTSTVLSPNSIQKLFLRRKLIVLQAGATAQTLGAGFGLVQLTTYCNANTPSNTAGFVRGYIPASFTWENAYSMGIGFSLYNATSSIYTGWITMARLGEPFTPTAGVVWPENPTSKRIGIKYVWGNSTNTIRFQIHDGTNYYEIDSGYVPTPFNNNWFHYFIISHNGLGTATVEIYRPNGSVITLTSNNAPTSGGDGVSIGWQQSTALTTSVTNNISPSHLSWLTSAIN